MILYVTLSSYFRIHSFNRPERFPDATTPICSLCLTSWRHPLIQTRHFPPFQLHLAGGGSLHPPKLTQVAEINTDLDYNQYYELIGRMDVCLPAFDDRYLLFQASSTVGMCMEVNVSVCSSPLSFFSRLTVCVQRTDAILGDPARTRSILLHRRRQSRHHACVCSSRDGSHQSFPFGQCFRHFIQRSFMIRSNIGFTPTHSRSG
jgi:hypothetical protein